MKAISRDNFKAGNIKSSINIDINVFQVLKYKIEAKRIVNNDGAVMLDVRFMKHENGELDFHVIFPSESAYNATVNLYDDEASACIQLAKLRTGK